MKINVLLFLFVAFILKNQAQTVTDIDSNKYNCITIGSQTWMAENLKVTHYRNGNPIPHVTDNTQWSSLSSGAFCNYNNNTNNTTLYNWFAVTDSQNIAPAGWHVPTDEEWTALTTFLGGVSVAGGILESKGFTATGSRNANGGYEYPDYGDWWASTECGSTTGRHRGHKNGLAEIYNVCFNKNYGFAVRCVKDNATKIEIKEKGNGVIIYPNPSNGKINIKFDSPKNNVFLEILDIGGHHVFSNTYNNITTSKFNIDVNYKGIYFIKLITDSETIYDKLILTE
jgi:uncharacterized protein (TIGR02145 family)